MLMCMESVYGAGGCNVAAIEHGRYMYSPSNLYVETVSSAGSVWYVGSFKLCCEILLLLNVAESDMDCLLHVRLWSEQC